MDRFRQGQRLLCHTVSFARCEEVQVNAGGSLKRSGQVANECQIKSAPVILSYVLKTFGDCPAGPVHQRLVQVETEERRVSGIKENARLCRHLTLHVVRNRLAGSKRELLLERGLEKSRVRRAGGNCAHSRRLQ